MQRRRDKRLLASILVPSVAEHHGANQRSGRRAHSGDTKRDSTRLYSNRLSDSRHKGNGNAQNGVVKSFGPNFPAVAAFDRIKGARVFEQEWGCNLQAIS